MNKFKMLIILLLVSTLKVACSGGPGTSDGGAPSSGDDGPMGQEEALWMRNWEATQAARRAAEQAWEEEGHVKGAS